MVDRSASPDARPQHYAIRRRAPVFIPNPDIGPSFSTAVLQSPSLLPPRLPSPTPRFNDDRFPDIIVHSASEADTLSERYERDSLRTPRSGPGEEQLPRPLRPGFVQRDTEQERQERYRGHAHWLPRDHGGMDDEPPEDFNTVPLTPRPDQLYLVDRRASRSSDDTMTASPFAPPGLRRSSSTRSGRAPPSRPPSYHSHSSRGQSSAISLSRPSSTSNAPSSWLTLPTLPSEKFTRKFPKPRPAAGAPAAADENAGLGLERMDRWTPHKWALLLSVATVFVYGMAGLVCALLTWFRTWPYAPVLLATSPDIVSLLTLFASLALLTALLGLTGALLSSRPLLAIYALLLWPTLLTLLIPAYTAYKRTAFALPAKVDGAWSRGLHPTPLQGRLALQAALHCCGWTSPLHEAAPSARCYARAPLPGCRGPLVRAVRDVLGTVWAAAFALVPLHLLNIAVALLCANHVTRTFGRGLTPRGYRLRREDVEEMWRRMVEGKGGVARPAVSRMGSGLSAEREDRKTRG